MRDPDRAGEVDAQPVTGGRREVCRGLAPTEREHRPTEPRIVERPPDLLCEDGHQADADGGATILLRRPVANEHQAPATRSPRDEIAAPEPIDVGVDDDAANDGRHRTPARPVFETDPPWRGAREIDELDGPGGDRWTGTSDATVEIHRPQGRAASSILGGVDEPTGGDDLGARWRRSRRSRPAASEQLDRRDGHQGQDAGDRDGPAARGGPTRRDVPDSRLH